MCNNFLFRASECAQFVVIARNEANSAQDNQRNKIIIVTYRLPAGLHKIKVHECLS